MKQPENKGKGEGSASKITAMDPSKLKVTELREELGNRGLDTSGLKAALVDRLAASIGAEAEAPPSSTELESAPEVITPAFLSFLLYREYAPYSFFSFECIIVVRGDAG